MHGIPVRFTSTEGVSRSSAHIFEPIASWIEEPLVRVGAEHPDNDDEPAVCRARIDSIYATWLYCRNCRIRRWQRAPSSAYFK